MEQANETCARLSCENEVGKKKEKDDSGKRRAVCDSCFEKDKIANERNRAALSKIKA